ncbi:protein-tyrosine phosphatase-like protein [Tuber brumale]|nr:protein-tyrosine phosphatase-like protein [Tuber brumale]
MNTHLPRAGPHSLHTRPIPPSTSSERQSRSRRYRHGRSKEKGTPNFLGLSNADIRRKFLDLELLQNERLHDNEDAQWKIDDSNEVRIRNRYCNIAPWDSNRVRLRVPTEHCDYINASPIVLKGRNGSIKRYIATQGPKEGQFNHIWRMVWQETSDVAVIVMLTKTFELGRDKCFQYFPEKLDDKPWTVDGDEEFGDGFKATISLLEKTKDKRSSCTVRKISLKVGEKEKIVWHLLFKGWPDFNVPEGDDRSALLEAIKLANEKNSGPQNPLIVHCSAGVGRSGTFITLDHFLREIDAGTISADEREDPVFEVVNQLREQRMSMVQSQVQYEFLYQVLKERFQRRAKSASPPTIPLDDLAETDSEFENGQGGVRLH